MEREEKVIKAIFKREKEEVASGNSGSIRIKQNKTKSNVRCGFRIVSMMVVATVCGACGGICLVQNKYGAALSGGNRTIFQVINNDETSLLEENSINRAIKVLSPSIVSVGVDEENMKLGNESESNGSGIIIRSNGYIATNYSLIKNTQNIFVKLPGIGSKPFKAKLIGIDGVSDLAVIKIEADNLQRAKFADTDLIKVGDVVIAAGNAIGDDYIGFVTAGTVTSKHKKIEVGKEESSDKKVYKVIQTSALINTENTGGVLCNINGEVVGINSNEITKKYLSNGLSYAIEIKDAEKIIESILDYGKVRRIALGFDGASLITKENSDIEGVYVQTTYQDGSAAKAGMRPTDIITEIAGKKVKKLEDVLTILDNCKAGEILECKVLRDGETEVLQVTLLENK